MCVCVCVCVNAWLYAQYHMSTSLIFSFLWSFATWGAAKNQISIASSFERDIVDTIIIYGHCSSFHNSNKLEKSMKREKIFFKKKILQNA